jgi:acyl carrier protein
MMVEIISEQLGVHRDQITPTSRFIEDLNCD